MASGILHNHQEVGDCPALHGFIIRRNDKPPGISIGIARSITDLEYFGFKRQEFHISLQTGSGAQAQPFTFCAGYLNISANTESARERGGGQRLGRRLGKRRSRCITTGVTVGAWMTLKTAVDGPVAASSGRVTQSRDNVAHMSRTASVTAPARTQGLKIARIMERDFISPHYGIKKNARTRIR